ncbi:45 kDa calcium-binding protein isoform X1 [Hydra vulgaris]|uniref:45 kDa calcium-binding protein n=1 Tax=Hydra vulgaris TaxID=6087 RepID=T2M6H2_HYDVU|nr:45 kDa calcium-binding protein [Hydra vulgaris]
MLLIIFKIICLVGSTISIPVGKLNISKTNILHSELLPPDHIRGAHLEQDGDVNKEFHHEAFLGKLLDDGKLEWENYGGYKKLIKIFHQVDKNKDHKISHEELKEWIHDRITEHFNEAKSNSEKIFERVDLNKDKFVSWIEYKSQLMDLDLNSLNNSDQAIDEKNEFLREAKNWKNADYDGNNILNMSEFVVFLHPEHNKRVIEIMADELITPMDVNKDGKISVEEFTRLPGGIVDPEEAELDKQYQKERKEEFERDMDADGDGFVTKEEFCIYLDPRHFQHASKEAKYLINIADQDKDGKLSEDEMLLKYQLFTGSSFNDYVKILHDEF